jgi:Icc-related predicted phosphoesterase
MKIALLSDVHLSVHPLPVPHTDADVVVVAGDVGRPATAIGWARQFARPTVFVAGNHEFYGCDLRTTLGALRREAAGTAVHVLEHDVWHHGPVRFLGCTLWSDHRLHATPEERAEGLRQAMAFVRDFSRIAVEPDVPDTLTPAVAQRLFDASVAWLDARFAEPHAGPTVVVTHFAPSRLSIHPRFAGSPINACFTSDLAAHIVRWQPRLWLHGHTHDSFDYRIGVTRVVCNPRGYAPDGIVENARFDPSLVLELDAEDRP